MKVVKSNLLSDLTAAIYTVISKNNLDYSKENATKVVTALGNICSTLCAISNVDLDLFLQEVKSSHDEFIKSDLIELYQKRFPIKESLEKDINLLEKDLDLLEKDIDLMTSEFNLEQKTSSITSDAVAFSADIFNTVYLKSINIMEEKNLLIADMPLLIGCIGAVAAYFCKIYNVKKDILTNTIDSYYSALDYSVPDQNMDHNAENLKANLSSDKSPVVDSSKKKKSYDIN